MSVDMAEDLSSMQRLEAVGGVEITDIDLSRPLSPATKERILNLFAAHPILVFRNQTLTKEQQYNFTWLVPYWQPLTSRCAKARFTPESNARARAGTAAGRGATVRLTSPVLPRAVTCTSTTAGVSTRNSLLFTQYSAQRFSISAGSYAFGRS